MTDDEKLLVWLLLLGSSSLCFCSELDVQCLKSLQRSLVDPNGILASSWNFIANNVTPGYICKFTGVECWHPDENRVLSVRLGHLGLQGTFPQGLQNCTSMIGLNLSSNRFSGPIPSDIWRQFPYLTSLDLSYNSFSGPIPVNITQMTYLNTLNLEHNQLSGEIPSEFNGLFRLTSFNVAGNLLSGPIPILLQKFTPSSFAGNEGLCGAPLLNNCPRKRRRRLRLHRINKESSMGAAVGFVVGFVVAFYFPQWFIFSRRLHPYIFRI
ncbi:hypothetical protein ABZP36_017059 [Zizania latifolia]